MSPCEPITQQGVKVARLKPESEVCVTIYRMVLVTGLKARFRTILSLVGVNVWIRAIGRVVVDALLRLSPGLK